MDLAPAIGHIRCQQLAPGIDEWRIEHVQRRNAVTPLMLQELCELAERAQGGVALLTSTDADFFCAGFDLSALAEGDELPDRALIAASAAIAASKAIIVAALDGRVIGAGVELACSCDLMLATPFTSFCIPAAQLGVVYHRDGLDRLTLTLGTPLVRRLMLTAQVVHADDPQLRPVFCEIVERSALYGRARELAQQLAAAPTKALQANAAWLRHLHEPAIDDRHAHDRARRVAYRSVEHHQALEYFRTLRKKSAKT